MFTQMKMLLQTKTQNGLWVSSSTGQNKASLLNKVSQFSNDECYLSTWMWAALVAAL